jgi:hypothetical protein
MTVDLVLTTVNAAYRRQLSARELVECLRDDATARALPGHMSAFFGEFDPALQTEFAGQFGITRAQLAAAAKTFAAYSGESYPLVA